MKMYSQVPKAPLMPSLLLTLGSSLRTVSVSVAALLLCLIALAQPSPSRAEDGDVTITTNTTINYALPKFLFLQNGATVSLVAGASVGGNVVSDNGTTVNISGGILEHDIVADGTVINLSSGSIQGRVFADEGTILNLSGGSLGSFVELDDSDSIVNVYGTGLRLLPPATGQQDYTLTGTLTDGTPINTPIRLSKIGTDISQVHLFNTNPFVGLEDQVVALGTSGVLNGGNTNALLTKLTDAQNAAAAGDVAAEHDALTAFLNQVKALVRTGKIPTAEGTALLTAAQDILDSLD